MKAKKCVCVSVRHYQEKEVFVCLKFFPFNLSCSNNCFLANHTILTNWTFKGLYTLCDNCNLAGLLHVTLNHGHSLCQTVHYQFLGMGDCIINIWWIVVLWLKDKMWHRHIFSSYLHPSFLKMQPNIKQALAIVLTHFESHKLLFCFPSIFLSKVFD